MKKIDFTPQFLKMGALASAVMMLPPAAAVPEAEKIRVPM